MKIRANYKFGFISKGGYKHFPLLYFGYGCDGFAITTIGLTITIKF